MNDRLTYRSTFIPQFDVIVDYTMYDDIRELFDMYGLAFVDPYHNLIFMDGINIEKNNITFPEMKFIEAHEIGHLILGKNELKADYCGIYLCRLFDLSDSMIIGIDEFNSRYRNSYSFIHNSIGLWWRYRIDKYLRKHNENN